MSLFTRSLLALAALLTAADALAWDSFVHEPGCSGFKISVIVFRDPQMEVSFDIPVTEYTPMQHIPDYCKKIGGVIQYQSVEVCNQYRGKTSSAKKAPKSKWIDEDQLSPIYVSCEGQSECGPSVMHITQKCNPALLY